MCSLKVGLIYYGNMTTDIWGCGITTHYLAKALADMGHKVWRHSVTHDRFDPDTVAGTDLLIVEGVNHQVIPPLIWQAAKVKAFWWLSELYYDRNTVLQPGYDAIATNSTEGYYNLKDKTFSAKIDLAADRGFCTLTETQTLYREFTVYLGLCSHKNQVQEDMLFMPALPYGLGLWGKGWNQSPFAKVARGILPFEDVAALYINTQAAFLLTESRQKERGMVNNRVFEVLASGCVAVSEPYPALAASDLGPYINFVENSADVSRLLERVKAKDEDLLSRAHQARQYVVDHHTYHHRAAQFIELYQRVITNKGKHAS